MATALAHALSAVRVFSNSESSVHAAATPQVQGRSARPQLLLCVPCRVKEATETSSILRALDACVRWKRQPDGPWKVVSEPLI
jgi:hypothetical protein